MGQGCGRQLTSVEAVSVLVASVSRKKYAFLRTERDESAYERRGGSGGRPGRGPPAPPAALLAPTDAPVLVYLYLLPVPRSV